MNYDSIWSYVQLGCYHANNFLREKMGQEFELPYYCTQTKAYVQEHCLVITIVIGVALLLMVANKVLRVLRNRVHKFDATLLGIREVTHDTKVFTFSLPKGWNKKFLQIGEHITLHAEIEGQMIDRKYTPISRSDVISDKFELLIKTYEKGNMSRYVFGMKLNEKIRVSMPYGRFNYLGLGIVRIRELNNSYTLKKYNHIYLIGGGTGITPLYQIIQYVSEVEAPEGKAPKVSLLFANRTENDILLKGELENYEISNPNFKCHFSVDRAVTDNWTGFTGFIDEQKVRKTIPEDIENTIFAACGPPIMVNLVEKLLTSKFKVSPKRFFRF